MRTNNHWNRRAGLRWSFDARETCLLRWLSNKSQMLLIGPRVSTLMCMRVDQLAVFLSAAASTAPTDDHENISRQDCDNDNDGVR